MPPDYVQSSADAPAASPDVSPHDPPDRSRTLLPSPVAATVSFGLSACGLYFRAWGWGIGTSYSVVKFCATTGLSGAQCLARGAVRATTGDPTAQTSQDLQLLNIDSKLATAVRYIHSSITLVNLFTAASLVRVEETVGRGEMFIHDMINHLNNFFGSTDSSRAVAGVIDMLLLEFRNPAPAEPGEKISPSLLIKSICTLAYLQSHCGGMKEEREFRAGLEEVLWDVVVLDDGTRLDVEGLNVMHRSGEQQHPFSNKQIEDTNPEAVLKHQILHSLPANATVDISTSTTVSKTIAIEVKGTDVIPFNTPPGATLVKKVRLDSDSTSLSPGDSSSSSEQQPTYRLVYQYQKRSEEETRIQGHGVMEESEPREIEDVTDKDPQEVETGSSTPTAEEIPPEVPPKSPRHCRGSEHAAPTAQLNQEQQAPSSRRGGKKISASSSVSRPAVKQVNQDGITLATPPKTRIPSLSQVPSSTSPPRSASRPSLEMSEKKVSFRAALKRGPGSAISTLLHKDTPPTAKGPKTSGTKKPSTSKIPQAVATRTAPPGNRLTIPTRTSSTSRPQPTRPPRRTAKRNSVGRDAGPYDLDGAIPSRPTSRASFVSVRETKRDSIISQTDTWSLHSRDASEHDLRPLSNSVVHQEIATQSIRVDSVQDVDGALSGTLSGPVDSAPEGASDGSTTPSDGVATPTYSCPTIYSIDPRQSSLSVAGAFQDEATIRRLQRTGMIPETFPRYHMLRNIVRYMRFSSATYGSFFLSAFGIRKDLEQAWKREGHLELNVFAYHTDIPTDDILMASFVDKQGGANASGSTESNIPLVHYVAVDHQSKAIVLACRGTMSCEDVLADLTCAYDDMTWRQKPYSVHKGIHASARRILYGRDGRVLMLLKEALEKYEDYGLVLTGHSLGGGVTALLGAMLAEPASEGFGFVTSSQPHQRLLEDGRTVDTTKEQVFLPAGRPIHVYAYGPPGTMCPRLQKHTRGLITTVVHGNDLVPYLSLGVLRDFQAVALAFKDDATGQTVKDELFDRLRQAATDRLNRFYHGRPFFDAREGELRDDAKAVAALKVLRACMSNIKLVPPGEVFAVESSKVLRRDAYRVDDATARIGRRATRVILKYVRDVEARFKEVRFGMHMALDHNPASYEDALNRLSVGVAGPGGF